ncbi:hypothetical protein JZ751_002600 [Albula glossodonta]|uniref:Uncharacterized protein n=1 Tax=Albula glossodonta TaxID=121402 RepID=A0A8T2N7G1_9TELE|nr:hypothetical protein JZ751_002600 [Albula glossodonta]
MGQLSGKHFVHNLRVKGRRINKEVLLKYHWKDADVYLENTTVYDPPDKDLERMRWVSMAVRECELDLRPRIGNDRSKNQRTDSSLHSGRDQIGTLSPSCDTTSTSHKHHLPPIVTYTGRRETFQREPAVMMDGILGL